MNRRQTTKEYDSKEVPVEGGMEIPGRADREELGRELVTAGMGAGM